MSAATAIEPRPWRRALAWLAFLGPFFFATYGFATWASAQRAAVPFIAFDWERSIPFWPWTIVPYWIIDALYAASLFVCTTRREQFFRAYHAKSLEQLGTEKVLTAVSSSRGKIGNSRSLATRQRSQQSAVLIIGMSSCMEDAGNDIKTVQRLRQAHRPTIFGNLGRSDQKRG